MLLRFKYALAELWRNSPLSRKSGKKAKSFLVEKEKFPAAVRTSFAAFFAIITREREGYFLHYVIFRIVFFWAHKN